MMPFSFHIGLVTFQTGLLFIRERTNPRGVFKTKTENENTNRKRIFLNRFVERSLNRPNEIIVGSLSNNFRVGFWCRKNPSIFLTFSFYVFNLCFRFVFSLCVFALCFRFRFSFSKTPPIRSASDRFEGVVAQWCNFLTL